MATLLKMGWVLLAVASLCGASSGCVSDTGATLSATPQTTGDRAPMRYYGGPKYPMWPDR